MKSVIRVSLAVAIVASFAFGAFAAVSDNLAQFGKGPASFLMTKEETAQWKNIATDADAQAFIDLFWARRDPTAGTARNEYREQFDQRVQYADEHFGTKRTKGSMTDRGKTLILLGAPTEAIRMITPATGGPQQGTRTDSETNNQDRPRQVWTYTQDKTDTPLGIKSAAIGFVDVGGDLRFERVLGTVDPFPVFESAKQGAIKQPNMTAADLAKLNAAQVTTTTTTVTKTTTTTTTTALKTPAYQAAVTEQKGGKSALSKSAQISYGEFVSPAGDYFVPVELVVPKSAGLTADAGDTIFGVVEDAAGTVVTSFEEPAKPLVSVGDLVVDKTLDLPTGKYTVILGLAKAGQPVAIASRTVDVKTIAKDATGAEHLVLTNDLHELETAAPVKAPFAFGKLKIVPKTTIAAKDELTYFAEVHNPGIDPTTNLPKMQVKVELAGGKLPRPIVAPLSDIPALPLSGTPGPGQYAVISSIPLSELSKPLDPGDYTLKVKLTDTITKQTYTLEQSFKIGG